MKCCRTCHESKPIEDFGIAKKTKGGRDNICKSCKNAASRKHYNLNSTRIKESQRARYTTVGKVTRATSVAAYSNKYPNKVKAHRAVNDAIRRGKLSSKPCQYCGLTVGVVAHHDDYLDRLNVRWLCAKHHADWHRLNGEALNGR